MDSTVAKTADELPEIPVGLDQRKPKKRAPPVPPVFQEDPPRDPDWSINSAGEMLTLTLEDLHPSTINPRKHFDDAKIQELAASIEVEGVLQNLLARPSAVMSNKTAEGTKPMYEIVAGESRWRAVGLVVQRGRDPSSVPLRVLVKQLSDAKVLELALIENTQRADLTPMEEARGLKALQDKTGLSANAIGARLGHSGRYVQLRLALVEKLAPPIQTAVEEGKLSVEHARVLAQAPVDQQAKLFKDTQGSYPRFRTGDDIRRAINKILIPEKNAAFDVALYTGGWIDAPARAEIEAGWKEAWDNDERLRRDNDDDLKYYLRNCAEDDAEDLEVAGQRCFADVAQFMALQKRAAKTKAAALTVKGAAWVEIKTGRFEDYHYDKKPGSKKAGAIISIDAHGQLEVHENLVKREARDRTGGASAAAAKAKKKEPEDHFTRPHLEHANRRRMDVLQRLVAAEPLHAMRVMCIGILTQGGAGCGLDLGARTCVDAQVAKDLSAQFAKHPAIGKGVKISAKNGLDTPYYFGSIEKADPLIAAVWKLPEAELGKLFARLVATNMADDETKIGVRADMLTIAKLLGVAGKEVLHGLHVSYGDLDGIEVPILTTIKAMPKDYVLPTMRFAEVSEIETAIHGLMPATAPAEKAVKVTIAPKAAAKPKAKSKAKSKPKAKPKKGRK